MPLEPHDPITITLGRSNVLNPELLVEPAWDTLGAEPDLELDNVEIRIGSRPQAFDLARLYTANRRDVPDLFRSTLDGFRLWLIAYSISVLRTPGKRRVESVSFEVAFPASPRVTVTDVFPKPIFINHLAITGEFNFKASASIDLSGQFQLPQEISQNLQAIALAPETKASAELNVGATGSLIGNLALTLVTPVVEAMGRGDDWSKWVFFRDRQPILNDITMIQVLVAPKVVPKLKPTVRVGATMSTFGLLPLPLKSDPVELLCSLPK